MAGRRNGNRQAGSSEDEPRVRIAPRKERLRAIIEPVLRQAELPGYGSRSLSNDACWLEDSIDIPCDSSSLVRQRKSSPTNDIDLGNDASVLEFVGKTAECVTDERCVATRCRLRHYRTPPR